MADKKRKIEEFMNAHPESSIEQMNFLGEMASKYANKKESEILEEMQELNYRIMKNNSKDHFEDIKKLNSYLNEEQKTKMEKIMDFLNPDEKKR